MKSDDWVKLILHLLTYGLSTWMSLRKKDAIIASLKTEDANLLT